MVLNNGGNKRRKIYAIPLAPMGVLAPGSAHAWRSTRPPIDTSGNFSAHVSGGGNFQNIFLINFLAKSGNSKHFSFFSKQKKIWRGVGVKNFKIFFWYIFSPYQAILSTFRFFRFFQKKINCGHYVCLPSTKIVVTMFACHFHNSSGMCLQLARTNHVSAESPSNISPNPSEVISEVSEPYFQKKT